MTDIDFAADAVGNPSVNTGPVIELARDMVRRERRIEVFEAELKREKEELLKIATETMPDLMRSCGVRAQELSNGWKLSCKPVFRASLPAPSTITNADPEEAAVLIGRLKAGLDCLKRWKATDIIKNTIKIELGLRQTAEATKFMNLAKQMKVAAERVQKVNPSTLSKYLKERVAAGKDVPFDTFAVFAGEIAEVIPPKIEKEKVNNGSKDTAQRR